MTTATAYILMMLAFCVFNIYYFYLNIRKDEKYQASANAAAELITDAVLEIEQMIEYSNHERWEILEKLEDISYRLRTT